MLWKIFGEGGWLHTASFKLKIVSYPLIAIKMIFQGDWKDLAYKINKKAMIPIRRYVNSRNVGS